MRLTPSVDRASSGLEPSASDPGVPVDLAPAVYQCFSNTVQSRNWVVIFILLVTNDLFRRPPVAGSERLVPAVITEF